jgi:hypothetical protein
MHSIEVILAMLITVWFMQLDGKACIPWSLDFMCGNVQFIFIHANCLCHFSKE